VCCWCDVMMCAQGNEMSHVCSVLMCALCRVLDVRLDPLALVHARQQNRRIHDHQLMNLHTSVVCALYYTRHVRFISLPHHLDMFVFTPACRCSSGRLGRGTTACVCVLSACKLSHARNKHATCLVHFAVRVQQVRH
jgi:hypothetical protein